MLNGNFPSFLPFVRPLGAFLQFHTILQNQLLALDKENNTIHTTIHTNLLVESFYETPLGSNNNLYCSNSIMASSPARESLLIDNDDDDDVQCNTCNSEQCNRSSCNQLYCNDGGVNNNDTCSGKHLPKKREIFVRKFNK